MDSFMDKLAQKFNAQEMIKANTLAEEKELQKAQIQASEYKEYLEQMKQLNQENAELTQKVQTLIEEVRTQNATQYEKISKLADSGIKTVAELASIQEEKLSQMNLATEDRPIEVDLSSVENSMTLLSENLENEKKRLSELFEQTNEYVHRENVKVYRNVQAVLNDQARNQSNLVSDQISAVEKTNKKQGVFIALTFLAAVGSLVVQILQLLNLI